MTGFIRSPHWIVNLTGNDMRLVSDNAIAIIGVEALHKIIQAAIGSFNLLHGPAWEPSLVDLRHLGVRDDLAPLHDLVRD